MGFWSSASPSRAGRLGATPPIMPIPRPQAVRLLIRAHPALLLASVGAIAVAVELSTTVVRLDAALGSLARAGASALPHNLEFAVSTLAGTTLVMPLTAVCAIGLCAARHWRGALTVVLAVVGTQALVALIKGLVERPRPEMNSALADASGFSFPSAHSATAIALYATLTLIGARATRGHARVLVVLAGASVVAAVGLSRVLVAAHYPSDVLAGWLTGAAVVAASSLLVSRLAVSPRATAHP